MKFLKVEHPVLGVSSMVPEGSLSAWGEAGWVLSTDQPADPDEVQPEPVAEELVEPEDEPEGDVTPVGDSVVEPPAETGTESAEG